MNRSDEFSLLKQEYEAEVYGRRLHALLIELCGNVSRSFKIDVYNENQNWDADAIANLANDVIEQQLLHPSRQQLVYIFKTAESLESVRRLLVLQIKRTLGSRRVKGPVDRLLLRVAGLADAGEINCENTPTGPIYRRKSEELHKPYAQLSKQQIRLCADSVRTIPVLFQRTDAVRQSQIYTKENLRTVVDLALNWGNAVSSADFRQIFENLLTPWAPTKLIPIENDSASGHSELDSPMEDGIVMKACVEFAQALSGEERLVLAYKFQDISDQVVADALGVSRPTVINRKKDVFSRLRVELLEEIPETDYEMAVRIVADRCVALLEEPQ